MSIVDYKHCDHTAAMSPNALTSTIRALSRPFSAVNRSTSALSEAASTCGANKDLPWLWWEPVGLSFQSTPPPSFLLLELLLVSINPCPPPLPRRAAGGSSPRGRRLDPASRAEEKKLEPHPPRPDCAIGGGWEELRFSEVEKEMLVAGWLEPWC